MSVRVLLADDHQLVRAGLHSLLDEQTDIEVIGEAADGEQAISMAHELAPEIIVMDIDMPGTSGLDATEILRRELPQTRVLILSMHATDDFVQQAIKAGASGYLLKDAASAELVLAISTVARGETWISPSVSSLVINRYLQRDETQPENPLTPRQTEILKLIAEGLATKEIAYQLNISNKTVESHRAQMMERLGIRDVAGLVRHAIRTGLIDAR